MSKNPSTASAPVLATREDQIKYKLKTRHIPAQLACGHSLKSINDAVVMRYHDRPLKLSSHLPFAVDYQNKSSALTAAPPTESIEDMAQMYADNIGAFEDRLEELSIVENNVDGAQGDTRRSALRQMGRPAASTRPAQALDAGRSLDSKRSPGRSLFSTD